MGAEGQKGRSGGLIRLAAAAAALALWAGAASAGPPSLVWPLACTLGEDCWIVHHVDAVPGPGAGDFRCGSLTYDGHKGTDVALRDRAAMFRPVAVSAAAAGTVKAVRDSHADHRGRETDIRAAMAAGEDCGNGVVIDHGEGWETQYCHLKSGSVRVAPGMAVAAGEPIAAAGQSGAAEFAHLHLSVRFQGREIDPFTALPLESGCRTPAQGMLWSDGVAARLPTVSAPILSAVGFRQAPPVYRALQEDAASHASLSRSAPALILWGMAFGLETGDTLAFRITGPDGVLVHRQSFRQERNQIRRMQFTGRRNTTGWLTPGTYTGTVRIERTGKARTLVRERSVRLRVTD